MYYHLGYVPAYHLLGGGSRRCKVIFSDLIKPPDCSSSATATRLRERVKSPPFPLHMSLWVVRLISPFEYEVLFSPSSSRTPSCWKSKVSLGNKFCFQFLLSLIHRFISTCFLHQYQNKVTEQFDEFFVINPFLKNQLLLKWFQRSREKGHRKLSKKAKTESKFMRIYFVVEFCLIKYLFKKQL